MRGAANFFERRWPPEPPEKIFDKFVKEHPKGLTSWYTVYMLNIDNDVNPYHPHNPSPAALEALALDMKVNNCYYQYDCEDEELFEAAVNEFLEAWDDEDEAIDHAGEILKGI